MVRSQFLKTIKDNNLIEKGDHIVVGFSGGPDSYSLLMLLLEISKEMDLTIYTAHLNHKFRGEEADADETKVAEISRGLGLRHFSKTVDCKKLAREQSISSEDAGRRARYKFLKEVEDEIRDEIGEIEFRGNKVTAKCREINSKIKIALGQNANDQAETVLFRLIRGSSLDGLGGIKYRSINEFGSQIIRPILDIKRTNIEIYCKDNNIGALMDKTNEEEIYTRNKIRLNLIPFIEKNFNGNFIRNLINIGEFSRLDGDFIWNEVEREFEEALLFIDDNRVRLDLARVRLMHRAIRSRIILKSLKILGREKNIKQHHIESIDSLMETDEGSKVVQLPQNTQASIGYGYIQLSKGDDRKKLRVKVEIKELSQLSDNDCNQENSEDIEYINRCNDTKSRTSVNTVLDCFDLDFHKFLNTNEIDENLAETIIKNNFKIRNRREGDFMRMKEDLGRKKIKKLLIDKKVLKAERDKINMIAFSNEILWIDLEEQGIIRSRKYNIDKDSKKLIRIEISEEI